MTTPAHDATISAIMPVYNGADFITKSLPPLLRLRTQGDVVEVIVVDDSSTDASAAIAAQLGATVLPSGGRLGPGAARNVAAQQARGTILWFVDADVVVHDDAAKKFLSAFADQDVTAVFGSYDDNPPVQTFAAQYKNLVHHFYHQRGRRNASTFWAGCGAVRKAAYLAVGGFDGQLYRRPAIEDIELGYRLIDAGGRIELHPDIQCTHLKAWKLWEVIRVDVFQRAIPWSRLLISRPSVPADLNISAGERPKAVLALACWAALFFTMVGVIPWWAALGVLALAWAVNRRLFGLFLRRRGVLFAMGGFLFHQLYYTYSIASYVWAWLSTRRPARVAAG